MKISTKTKIVAGAAIILAVGGGIVVIDKPTEEPTVRKEGKPAPTIGFIVDEPISKPEDIKARLNLLQAGGYYDRDVSAVVTSRTHPDNLKALQEDAHVIKITQLTDTPTKGEAETTMKTELGTTLDYYIKSTEQ